MSFSDAVTAMMDEGKRMQPVPAAPEYFTHAHYFVSGNLVMYQGDPTKGDTNPPQDALLTLAVISRPDWQEITQATKDFFGYVDPPPPDPVDPPVAQSSSGTAAPTDAPA